MNFWPSDTFSKIADWCGIIGLLVSIGSLTLTAYLTVTATQVRREFQDKVLLPVYLTHLQDHCKNMKIILVEMMDGVLIDAELGRIEGNLKSLRKKLRDEEDQKTVNGVLEAVSVYRASRDPTNLSELNSRINSLTRQLENKVQELQWTN